MNNNYLTVGVLVVLLVAIGAYFYPTQLAPALGSAVGSTFSTQKMATVDISPLTDAASSTSILNTDASARWIDDFGFAGCTGLGTSFSDKVGAGIASLAVQAATTSVANNGLQGNTNYALNLNISTTSSLGAFSANSTTTMPTDFRSYWASGTNITFTFNATSTGACVVEIGYTPS